MNEHTYFKSLFRNICGGTKEASQASIFCFLEVGRTYFPGVVNCKTTSEIGHFFETESMQENFHSFHETSQHFKMGDNQSAAELPPLLKEKMQAILSTTSMHIYLSIKI